jgi:hypothetical protein
MEGALAAIRALLDRAAGDDPPFPPTLLFEEGWMLRLVLQWFSQRPDCAGHILAFAPGARWFSEARLASAFLPRYRGDRHAEGYTHADGVIGHLRIGGRGRADVAVEADARQFVVAEAKMFSGLSKGTTRAQTYNQAARNIACMAELLRRADCRASSIPSLAFLILAPDRQVGTGIFNDCMDKSSLEQVVRDRVAAYDAPKIGWLQNWFLPTLEAMTVSCVSWESVITFIRLSDPDFANDLRAFYDRCLTFNRLERVGFP